MNLKYRVQLSATDRDYLHAFTRRGDAKAREVTRARALLLADGRTADHLIASALGIGKRTVARLRQRCVEEGARAALHDRSRPGAAPKLDDDQRARLFTIACSDPPTGRRCWTMQLLADQLVALMIVDSISDETVRRTLKKGGSSPA